MTGDSNIMEIYTSLMVPEMAGVLQYYFLKNLKFFFVYSPFKRILLLNVEIENKPLVIAMVYAPTKDSVEYQNSFLQDLNKLLENISNKTMIIGGDFNTYLRPELDKQGGRSEQNSLYHSILISLME